MFLLRISKQSIHVSEIIPEPFIDGLKGCVKVFAHV
jgi:hypothetical protein